MVHAKPRTCPGDWETKIHLRDFEIQTDNLISARRLDLKIISDKKKKSSWRIMDFAILADHRIKLKESEKKDKYLNFTRELKTLWNMKMVVKRIVISALSTVTKGLVKGLEDLEIRGRVETIQTTALLRSASEKTTRDKALEQKPYQRNKYLCCTPR